MNNANLEKNVKRNRAGNSVERRGIDVRKVKQILANSISDHQALMRRRDPYYNFYEELYNYFGKGEGFSKTNVYDWTNPYSDSVPNIIQLVKICEFIKDFTPAMAVCDYLEYRAELCKNFKTPEKSDE